MNKKLLRLYRNWLKNGMPGYGLCQSLAASGQFDKIMIIRPTWKDLNKLGDKDISYWGSDSKHKELHKFTTLRQNLLLLAACYYGTADAWP